MNDIKEKIKDILDVLKPDTLKDVIIEERHKKNPLDMDIPSYPVAFIGALAITDNQYHDNVSYEMEVTSAISVIMKPENFATTAEIEDLMYQIAFLFMDSETLGENCLWIKPTTTEPVSFTHGNRQLVEFVINLTIRKLVFKTTNP